MDNYLFKFNPNDCNVLYFKKLIDFLNKINPESEKYKRISIKKINKLNLKCIYPKLLDCEKDSYFLENKKQIILGRFLDTIPCFYACTQNYFAMAMTPYSLFKNDVFIRYIINKTSIFINDNNYKLETIFPIRILLSKNHLTTTHKLRDIINEYEYYSEINQKTFSHIDAISNDNLKLFLDLENNSVIKNKITENIPINHVIGRELCILYYMNLYFYTCYDSNNILEPFLLVSKYNIKTINKLYEKLGYNKPNIKLLYKNKKKNLINYQEQQIINFCFKYNFITYNKSIDEIKSYIYSNVKNLDKIKFDNTIDFMWNYIGYFLVITVDNNHNVKGFFMQNRTKRIELKIFEKNIKKFYGKNYINILKNKYPNDKVKIIKKLYKLLNKQKDNTCTKKYNQIDMTNLNDIVLMNNLIWQWEHSYFQSDYYSSTYFNLFNYVISKQNIKNKVYFINYFDRPVLHKKYKFYLYNTFEKHNIKNYMKIYSPSSSDDYEDIPIPTPDLWEMVTDMSFGDTCRKIYNQKPLEVNQNNKIEQIFFRGSNTSIYPNDVNNNQRLNLLKYIDSIKNKYPPDFFNVGINTLTKTSIITDNGELVYSDINKIKKQFENFKLVDFIPMYEQSKYKFILDIDGVSTSWRLPYYMQMNSPILKLQSEFYEYYYKFNEFNSCVEFFTINNFEEKIQLLINNKKYVNKINKNSAKFFNKYFNRNAIVKYMIKIIS
jgi:hypothetical protein